MVMFKWNLPLIPAEEIGHHLGLVVPKEELQYFWHGTTAEKPPRAGWGTRIYLPEFSLDSAFQRLKIPLRSELNLIDKFPDPASVRQYLERAELEDQDVLVCFDYGALHGTDYHGGHVNVFDRIDGNHVRLVDPETKVPKWRVVEVDKLFAAMKSHGPGKSGGFWKLVKT
jgi:hypothetical protein